jgi:hypothetical protein
MAAKKMKSAARGVTKQMPTADQMGSMGMAKGGVAKAKKMSGSTSARADGIAKKGKTKTKMPKMAMGGYAMGGKTKGC